MATPTGIDRLCRTAARLAPWTDFLVNTFTRSGIVPQKLFDRFVEYLREIFPPDDEAADWELIRTANAIANITIADPHELSYVDLVTSRATRIYLVFAVPGWSLAELADVGISEDVAQDAKHEKQTGVLHRCVSRPPSYFRNLDMNLIDSYKNDIAAELAELDAIYSLPFGTGVLQTEIEKERLRANRLLPIRETDARTGGSEPARRTPPGNQSSPPDNGRQPLLVSPSGAVQLFDRSTMPVVNGNKKDVLTVAQYAIVRALLLAGEKRMKLASLKAIRPGCRDILKTLERDIDWANAIDRPRKKSVTGYAIL